MTKNNNWMKDFSEYIRGQFPSLNKKVNGHPIAYLDGPGGYQVPQKVIDAIDDYLQNYNANIRGEFKTSQKTDEIILETRKAFADFFNSSWEEVIFGSNMTTLNFMLAQALKRKINPGEEILITQLDHEGNRDPWKYLKNDGVVIKEIEMNHDDLTLDMSDFHSKLTENTEIVAVTYASNAVGTIPDVKSIIEKAHEVGALTVVDAVHYAAHFPIDVKKLDTDFLLCSAYKFFGPHIGILYAKRKVLSELDTLKVRPQKDKPPYKFETGTLNHEGIAGAKEAVEFVAEAGKKFFSQTKFDVPPDITERRKNILAGLHIFEKFEKNLTEKLVDGLSQIPDITLYRPPLDVPTTSTVSFTHNLYSPKQIASYLNEKGIFVWDGDFYATRLVEKLGLQDKGGLIRIGISPYNTKEEIDRTIEALSDSESMEQYFD